MERFTGAVNRDKSLIRGVSLIRSGPTKGHDMDVDETTLGQIMALFPPAGLRGKINHRDPAGVLSTNGRHVNPRITREADGMHIRTDWQLSEGRGTTPEILSLAEDQPEDCGISIRCLSTKQVGPDRRAKMQVSSLLSADLVDVPAANESLLEVPGTMTNVTEFESLSRVQEQIDGSNGLAKTLAAQRAAKQFGPGWQARLTQLSSNLAGQMTVKEGGNNFAELETLLDAQEELNAATGLVRVHLDRELAEQLGPDGSSASSSSMRGRC